MIADSEANNNNECLDYDTITENIQRAIDEFYDIHKYLSDEAIDNIIDRMWEDIPEDIGTIELNHPGIWGSIIIIEFNEDYDEDDEESSPYTIYRVYDSDEEESADETQIDNGLQFEARLINLVLQTTFPSMRTTFSL